MREHNGDAEASIGGGGGEEIMATVRELAELERDSAPNHEPAVSVTVVSN